MTDETQREVVDEDEEGDILTLQDENGEEHDFIVVDMLELDGKEFVIVVPADDEEEGEALALEVQGEDLVVVEEDATLEKINAYLQAQGAAEA